MTRTAHSLLTAFTLLLSSASMASAQNDSGVSVTEKTWSTSTSWTSKGGKVQTNTGSKRDTSPATTAWCFDAARQPFPSKQASGKLNGRPIRIDSAELEGAFLTLTHGANASLPESRIKIGFYSKVGPNQAVIVKEGTTGMQQPSLWLDYKEKPGELMMSGSDMYGGSDKDRFGMRLQFGQPQNGLLPGYIVLRLPDAQHSFVEGYFYAKMK